MLGNDARQIDTTYETIMNDKSLRSVLARSLNRKDLDFVDQFLKDNGCQRLHRHKLPYCSDKAMQDREKFISKVFGLKNFDSIDLFCCVVAKHNIRTQNNYVPVIDFERIKGLLKSMPTNSAFHTIRNHQYETELPEFAKITYQSVSYGGYIFNIPAICFESPITI